MSLEINFDSILPKEIPVTLGDTKYLMREASGVGSDAYRKVLASCTKIEDGKVTVTDPSRAMEAGKVLVSYCLWDSEGKAVPLAVIQSWPGRIGDALVEAAIELCGIGKDMSKREDLKNS